MLCSLQKNGIFFWNKFFNLPFLAMPFPVSPFDIFCIILIPKSGNCTADELAKQKKWLIIKRLYKTACFNFYQFHLFSLTAVWVLFLLPYQSVCHFEKLIRFHRQVFIVYKTGENLKILIKIFRQQVIVSNVILAFLDHLKLKIFFADQPWWPTDLLFSKSLDPPLTIGSPRAYKFHGASWFIDDLCLINDDGELS